MDSQNTDQKLAVITGGASGIGLSCSKRFAKEGYAVLIIDANKEAGEQELKTLNQMVIMHILLIAISPNMSKSPQYFKDLENKINAHRC
jgi:NAD(P)-dependent dehydrogenase (short-subunit alcohol dehydrogenase family)